MVSFCELGLSSEMVSHLNAIGFVEPTEIQVKAIGTVSAGEDLIASAQTGSGKTAAYALPLIAKLSQSTKAGEKVKTRALVVVPTRELATQVATEFERFGKPFGLKLITLFGGVGYRKQIQALHRGVDVIVATPGRLVDCVNRNYANLNVVEHVVLDEADRLLDMGFMPQVRAVMARVPKVRQTLMFSATIDNRIKDLAEEFLQSPEVIQVNNDKVEAASIDQQFHYIKEKEKQKRLVELIGDVSVDSMLVFTKTKRKASQLTAALRELEIPAEEIHGDISQKQRSYTIKRFRDGEFCILIATDVAARGLDIPSISHVVNFDLPMLAEDYVHRIGRTGRAGRAGFAHSFVSNDQRHLVKAIFDVLKNGNGKREVVEIRSARKVVEIQEEYQPKEDAYRKPLAKAQSGSRSDFGREAQFGRNRFAKRYFNDSESSDGNETEFSGNDSSKLKHEHKGRKAYGSSRSNSSSRHSAASEYGRNDRSRSAGYGSDNKGRQSAVYRDGSVGKSNSDGYGDSIDQQNYSSDGFGKRSQEKQSVRSKYSNGSEDRARSNGQKSTYGSGGRSQENRSAYGAKSGYGSEGRAEGRGYGAKSGYGSEGRAEGRSYGAKSGYGSEGRAEGRSYGAKSGYGSEGRSEGRNYGAKSGYGSEGRSEGRSYGAKSGYASEGRSEGRSYGAKSGYGSEGRSEGRSYGAKSGYGSEGRSEGRSYGAKSGYGSEGRSEGRSYGAKSGYGSEGRAEGRSYGAKSGYGSEGRSEGRSSGSKAAHGSAGRSYGKSAVGKSGYGRKQGHSNVAKSAHAGASRPANKKSHSRAGRAGAGRVRARR